jgi:XTP/dITP diphosphohydrolase
MKIIIASHNSHKIEEMARILHPLGVEVITLDGLSEPEETGQTFAENAYIKASAACRESGLPAVADDSGLCVDALDGAPGVYSARYAGEGATARERNDKLLREMAKVPVGQRTARFVCAVCCVFPDGMRLTAEGVCEGEIAFEASGDGGFGYDPLFLWQGRSFALLTAAEKDAVSHRGQALRAFTKKLKDWMDKKC